MRNNNPFYALIKAEINVKFDSVELETRIKKHLDKFPDGDHLPLPDENVNTSTFYPGTTEGVYTVIREALVGTAYIKYILLNGIENRKGIENKKPLFVAHIQSNTDASNLEKYINIWVQSYLVNKPKPLIQQKSDHLQS